jgi:hypothetical protein
MFCKIGFGACCFLRFHFCQLHNFTCHSEWPLMIMLFDENCRNKSRQILGHRMFRIWIQTIVEIEISCRQAFFPFWSALLQSAGEQTAGQKAYFQRPALCIQFLTFLRIHKVLVHPQWCSTCDPAKTLSTSTFRYLKRNYRQNISFSENCVTFDLFFTKRKKDCSANSARMHKNANHFAEPNQYVLIFLHPIWMCRVTYRAHTENERACFQAAWILEAL